VKLQQFEKSYVECLGRKRRRKNSDLQWCGHTGCYHITHLFSKGHWNKNMRQSLHRVLVQ